MTEIKTSKRYSFLAGLALIAAFLLAALTAGCTNLATGLLLVPTHGYTSGQETFHATTSMPDYGTGNGVKK